MRYNPRTDRAIDLNELAEQCMGAVRKRAEQVRLAQAKQLNACLDLPAYERR